jgi:dihydrofolate reductase
MVTNPTNGTTIPVCIVAGLGASTRAIGLGNSLLWHVPDDMKRFKALTLGHPVIMGRKTFESIVAILGKPLPGRSNIVVTRNTDYAPLGAVVVHSLEAAFAEAAKENPTEIHIGGGADLYTQALPFTDRLFLTFFYDDKAGDTFFPDFTTDFEEVAKHGRHTHDGVEYEWVDLVRKTDNGLEQSFVQGPECIACEG